MTSTQPRLPLWTKLVYGSGDWGMASFNTLRQIFYAIFLTDVVGLDPRLGPEEAEHPYRAILERNRRVIEQTSPHLRPHSTSMA